MLELLRWERFRPRQVYRTEIHPVNLPKQLSLSWFLKVLPRYFVCTCHMTYIRHHILIKTDTSVFPGKAAMLRLQERLSCSVHVTAAWASSLLKGKGGDSLPGSRCTRGQLSLVTLLFAVEQATARHSSPSVCYTHNWFSTPVHPAQMLWSRSGVPQRRRASLTPGHIFTQAYRLPILPS